MIPILTFSASEKKQICCGRSDDWARRRWRRFRGESRSRGNQLTSVGNDQSNTVHPASSRMKVAMSGASHVERQAQHQLARAVLLDIVERNARAGPESLLVEPPARE
jgi:hypothetical protein